MATKKLLNIVKDYLKETPLSQSLENLNKKTSDVSSYLMENKVKSIIDEVTLPSWLKYVSIFKYFIILAVTISVIISLVFNLTRSPDDETSKRLYTSNVLIMNYFVFVILIVVILGLATSLNSGLELIKFVF